MELDDVPVLAVASVFRSKGSRRLRPHLTSQGVADLARAPGVMPRLSARILAVMTRSEGPRRSLPASPFTRATAPAPEQFAVGDRVTHDKHGLGRVVAVEDDDASVIVDFGAAHRRISTPFKAMTKL